MRKNLTYFILTLSLLHTSDVIASTAQEKGKFCFSCACLALATALVSEIF